MMASAVHLMANAVHPSEAFDVIDGTSVHLLAYRVHHDRICFKRVY